MPAPPLGGAAEWPALESPRVGVRVGVRVRVRVGRWAFAAAWKLVAPLLPEQTRKKVAIMGKGFMSALLDEIDESELPPLLGGTRTKPSGLPRAERVPTTLGARLRSEAGGAQVAAVHQEKI